MWSFVSFFVGISIRNKSVIRINVLINKWHEILILWRFWKIIEKYAYTKRQLNGKSRINKSFIMAEIVSLLNPHCQKIAIKSVEMGKKLFRKLNFKDIACHCGRHIFHSLTYHFWLIFFYAIQSLPDTMNVKVALIL